MQYNLALLWLPFSLAFHLPNAFNKQVQRSKIPINECSAGQIIDLLNMETSDEGVISTRPSKTPTSYLARIDLSARPSITFIKALQVNRSGIHSMPLRSGTITLVHL
ncbi:hypothetical protein NXS19_006717 [Fusarium pseudograminearum]|nr:hypothetical protein NXS19_006717 [Fusarium pseudograminearum]